MSDSKETLTLAAQLKKVALAKRAVRSIDYKQVKMKMIRDCRVLSETGAMSRAFSFDWLDIPAVQYDEAFIEIRRLLEEDGFVVTKTVVSEIFEVSWG